MQFPASRWMNKAETEAKDKSQAGQEIERGWWTFICWKLLAGHLVFPKDRTVSPYLT